MEAQGGSPQPIRLRVMPQNHGNPSPFASLQLMTSLALGRTIANVNPPAADLRRLHKYMLEVEGIDHISDEMRAVVESEWPELAHKLPPKTPQG